MKLYRTFFCFSDKGKDYIVNYFHEQGESKFFTETITSLTDSKILSKKKIEYKTPDAVQAQNALNKILTKKIEP